MLEDLNEIKPSIAFVEREPGRRHSEQNLLEQSELDFGDQNNSLRRSRARMEERANENREMTAGSKHIHAIQAHYKSKLF